MKSRWILFAIVLFAIWLVAACGGKADQTVFRSSSVTNSDKISASEASRYVGDRKTVCGDVESATYAASSRGQPTFLNLDKPFPQQIFTVVIWGRNRSQFPESPESTYRNRYICVSGLIETFEGVPQIEATGPNQFGLDQ